MNLTIEGKISPKLEILRSFQSLRMTFWGNCITHNKILTENTMKPNIQQPAQLKHPFEPPKITSYTDEQLLNELGPAMASNSGNSSTWACDGFPGNSDCPTDGIPQ